MKDVAEVLYGARNRIEDFENWTHGAIARDKDGNVVDPGDESACQWCAIGALAAEFPEIDLNKATTEHTDKLSVLIQAKNRLIAASGGSIVGANDYGFQTRGRRKQERHELVLRCFDKASKMEALEKTYG